MHFRTFNRRKNIHEFQLSAKIGKKKVAEKKKKKRKIKNTIHALVRDVDIFNTSP